jgi:hypothetical protein
MRGRSISFKMTRSFESRTSTIPTMPTMPTMPQETLEENKFINFLQQELDQKASVNDPIFTGTLSAIQSQFGNGSVTSPSISFINDPSVGIYKKQNATIGFAVDGSEVLAISKSGLEIPSSCHIKHNDNCINLGSNTGRNTLNPSIAIGQSAMEMYAPDFSIGIGHNSLQSVSNKFLSDIIAIGRNAQKSGSGFSNTILLNASGNPLEAEGESRFYVNPVRYDSSQLPQLSYSLSNEIFAFSDSVKLKKNINPKNVHADDILKIQIVEYDTLDGQHVTCGINAEDCLLINKDFVILDSNDLPLTSNHQNLILYAIEKIKIQHLEIGHLKDEITSLKSENENVTKVQMNQIKDDISSLNSENENVTKVQINGLKDEITSLKSDNENVTKAQINGLKDEITSLKSENENVTKVQINGLKDEITSLKSENENVTKAQINGLKDEITSLKSDNENVTKVQINGLKDEITSLKSENENVTKVQINGLKDEITSLKSENENIMNVQINGLKDEITSLKSENENIMNVQINGLKDEITSLKSENVELKYEISSLKSENERLTKLENFIKSKFEDFL